MSNGQIFKFSNSKQIAGKEAASRADLSSDVHKRIDIEKRLQGLDWNIIRVEDALAKAVVSMRNGKATLKEHTKGSTEYDAISRESERLEKEIADLKAKLKTYKEKRQAVDAELEKALELYQTTIDREIGNHIYSSMVNTIQSAISDAKDLHAATAAELIAIEKKYSSKLVKSARGKIDAAMKVVTAVEKAMGKA